MRTCGVQPDPSHLAACLVTQEAPKPHLKFCCLRRDRRAASEPWFLGFISNVFPDGLHSVSLF